MVLLIALAIAAPGFTLGAIAGAVLADFNAGAAKAVALGLVLAIVLYLLAWVTGGLSNAPDPNCGGCEGFQEPNFTITLLVIAYVGWLLGVALGVGVRRAARH